MMDWFSSLMQPQNQEALLNTLAQKGAPPAEALDFVQKQGAPQMSQIPGAPGSFAGMLQQAGAPGQVPMQPSPDGATLQPVPPPQMTVDPNMPQGPQPLQFGPQPEAQPNPGLSPEQMMQLMARGQGQGQEQGMRPPPPPGLMSGTSVRAPEMLQTQGQRQQPRLSLAQLLYGR